MKLDQSKFKGYEPNFINNNLTVALPKLNAEINNDIALFDQFKNGIIPYHHYSVCLSQNRKFPFFTASNIDGATFRSIKRENDDWDTDDRIGGCQHGSKLYEAQNSNFDKGHMTKREDVQWGKNDTEALDAALSTFYYTNAVPQHKDLNRAVWKSLEYYMLHTEAVKHHQKICVFTGPVLLNDDPNFQYEQTTVQLPLHFWKVVFFTKNDNKLYRVGFVMSQQKLLKHDHVIKKNTIVKPHDPFMEFSLASTYQVNVNFIESVCQLSFQKAIDIYTKEESKELIFSRTDISPKNKIQKNIVSNEPQLDFEILNISL